MRAVVIFFLSVISIKVYTQSPVSFYTYFGSNQDDAAHCVIQTMNGGYMLVGQTTGFSAIQNDILLSKTDSAGVPVWNKIFGGVGVDIGKALVELQDSSIVFVGYSNSFGGGGYDALICRVDKSGNQLWQKTFGGTNWDFANSINKTSDGNLIICGSTYSFGRGGKDGFVLKIDYSGNFLWQKFYGGTDDDELNKIIQTNDGGFIGAGTTKSYGDSLGDVWVTKLDANGDSTWFITRGGNKKEVGNAIVQDNVNHEYFVTGGSETYSSGKEDAYIFKLTINGTFVWDRYYGTATQDEESYDIINAIANYGNLIITYATKEQNTYGLDIKTLLLDGFGFYARGGTFGGYNDDVGYSLCNTKDKGYVAAGYTQSFNAQLMDVFIVKYDSEMTIGPLVTPIKEISGKSGVKIYPTIISDKIFYVEHNDPEQNIVVKIYDVYGREISILRILEEKNNLLKLILPQDISGVIFVRLNNGLTKKCIIQ